MVRLTDMTVDVKPQHKFNKCSNKNKLPFKYITESLVSVINFKAIFLFSSNLFFISGVIYYTDLLDLDNM